MIKTAPVTLYADRWTPFAYVIAFAGIDLSKGGADLHAQVRQYADQPGDPMIDLPLVTDPTVTGTRLLAVDTTGPLPVSFVRIQITADAMRTLPEAPELGDDLSLAWDMIVTPVAHTPARWLAGPFVIRAGSAQLDGLELAADPVPGTADAIVNVDAASLTVTLAGADLLTPLLARIEDAADGADASELAAQAAQAAAAGEADKAQSAVDAAQILLGNNVTPFDSYAAANAAAIAANAYALVWSDETLFGARTVYQKTGGALVYKGTIGPTFTPDAELLRFQANRAAGGLYVSMLDSLSAGAAGGSYRTLFDKIMRANLGDGGPGYIPFENGKAAGSGYFHTANVAEFALTDANSNLTKYGAYSISGTGQVLKGAGDYFFWTPPSLWKTARFFYLKGPDQAAFKWKFTTAPDAAYTVVDCYAANYQVGYIDVVAPGTAQVGLNFSWAAGNTNAAGDAVLFGADWILDAGKYRQGCIAVGGRWQHWVAQQDATAMKAFWAALAPQHVMIDGGMNDRTTITAAQYQADLTAILTNIQAASAATAVTIAQSLEPADAGSTNFRLYTAKKIAAAKAFGYGYIDLRQRLGASTYTQANAAGLMVGDGVHPSAKGVALMAQAYASYLGVNLRAQDPGATAFAGGGGGTPAANVYKGSLSTQHFGPVAAGAVITLKDIGLPGGYPECAIDITVTAQKAGAADTTVKRFKLIINGLAAANTAARSGLGQVPTITVEQSCVGSAGAAAYDFTLAQTQNNGRWQLTFSPIGADAASVVVDGSYRFLGASPAPLTEN